MRGIRCAIATLAATALLAPAGAHAASGRPTPKPLDVLFIGAHPDDEAFGIAAYGQWSEYHGVRTGVITVTRGEGGGNAVGPEEGPPLGLIREGEERRAVGRGGITRVYNLDKVDFYYTVSAPLTEQIWGHSSTLAKIVRVVRETRPKVVLTMDPAPSPGNHGNHQYAARLAIEAFAAAADPRMFPSQLTREHLHTWRVSRIFTAGFFGSPTGPDCARHLTGIDPTDVLYGVYSGVPSKRNGGTLWAQVEWDALHNYATQGWAAFPKTVPPSFVSCDVFGLVDGRTPFTLTSTKPVQTLTSSTAALEGALVRARGGLPLGTELSLAVAPFDAVPGRPVKVTVRVRAASASHPLRRVRVSLGVPSGWKVRGSGVIGTVRRSGASATFRVTPPAGATLGARVLLKGTLHAAGGRSGTTYHSLRVVPAVEGALQQLPQVAEFDAWARAHGEPQLVGLVNPVLTIGSGQSRTVAVTLTNHGARTESGAVRLTGLHAGFAATPASRSYSGLAPGTTTSVSFTVTNTDATLKTANEGGDYAFGIETTSSTGTAAAQPAPAFELVPVTTIPHAATAPTVDGVEGAGEYAGPALDLSRVWEGDPCASAADCSATAKVAWSGDALYLVVHVRDDVLGTVLSQADCKRHWRVDSVEIAIDPRGTSENTSTTFKTGILPTTTNGQPCAERDADNHQGPAATTAPGMQVKSVVTSPYSGYTVETKIPFADLPAGIDPARMGLNVFVYDSDTQDKTGQTRIGWSTWGGVQGDPYRWGLATLSGLADAGPKTPKAPVIPLTAAHSVDSPQSILQAAGDHVGLGGDPWAPASRGAAIVGRPSVHADGLHVTLRTRARGTAHVFVWTGSEPDGHVPTAHGRATLPKGGANRLVIPLSAAARTAIAGGARVLVAWVPAAGGGTVALAARVG